MLLILKELFSRIEVEMEKQLIDGLPIAFELLSDFFSVSLTLSKCSSYTDLIGSFWVKSTLKG